MEARHLAGCATLVAAVALVSLARPAEAQDLRSKVVLEIQRVEAEIHDRRWNLNTLDEKRELQKELVLLAKLYDRIVQHESDLMTFECSGSTINPSGGPPISTEDSDELGVLAIGSQQSINPSGQPPLPSPGSSPEGPGATPAPTPTTPGTVPFRYVFIRQITDSEVQLLAQIVYIDDRLRNDDWHLNNLEEKRGLEAERARAMAALRRVRNGRC